MRTLPLALVVTLLLPTAARGETTESIEVSEDARPWTLYAGIGFPGINSFAIGRWVGGVEALAELGTLSAFPAFVTGSAQIHVDVLRRDRTAVFVGGAAAALYMWFTGYEGEGSPYWNWGAGPKLGVRHTYRTKVRLSLEGGALVGNWKGTCGDSCRVMPLVMARLGWSF